MLNSTFPRTSGCMRRSRQQGMMLFMAMIVLVAIMIGTVALFRSLDSNTIMAGNIGLQKTATAAADRGTEAANVWLASASAATLYNNTDGYVANGLEDVPGTNETWLEWWKTYTAAHPAVSVAEDSNGNTASYIIQRLCASPGNPKDVVCSTPPDSVTSGNNQSSDAPAPPDVASAVYYRITTRVVGPRNTISLTQAIVSL